MRDARHSHGDLTNHWGLHANVVRAAEAFTENGTEQSRVALIKSVGALQADRSRLSGLGIKENEA